jgi:hypothetical protein
MSREHPAFSLRFNSFENRVKWSEARIRPPVGVGSGDPAISMLTIRVIQDVPHLG